MFMKSIDHAVQVSHIFHNIALVRYGNIHTKVEYPGFYIAAYIISFTQSQIDTR